MPKDYHIDSSDTTLDQMQNHLAEIVIEDTEYDVRDETAALCHCLLLIKDELVEIREALNR